MAVPARNPLMRAAAASVWELDAGPAPSLPPLDGDRTCDVAIVGAGFTGLVAAHELGSGGVDCVVIDAEDAGWGGSGRSAGFLVLRYKTGFAALAARFGDEGARLLHQLLVEATATVREVAEQHGLSDRVSWCGHVTAAHAPRALAALEADRSWLERVAGERGPRILGGGEVREALGTDAYVGGYFDPRAGALHPLGYVRGLAASLSRSGIPIFARTPMTGWRRDGKAVVVETPRGEIRARALLLATNAYAGLLPGVIPLQRHFVAVASSLIATEPLPARLAGTLVPLDAPVTDTKRLLNGFRKLPDGRLLFAGRGDITGRSDDPHAYRPLEQAMREIFPALRDVPVAHRWSGFVAMPAGGIPHLGSLADNVFYAAGYAGRGVLVSHVLGRALARLATGRQVALGPLSDAAFPAVPFPRLRVPMLRALAKWYAWHDRRDRRRG